MMSQGCGNFTHFFSRMYLSAAYTKAGDHGEDIGCLCISLPP